MIDGVFVMFDFGCVYDLIEIECFGVEFDGFFKVWNGDVDVGKGECWYDVFYYFLCLENVLNDVIFDVVVCIVGCC